MKLEKITGLKQIIFGDGEKAVVKDAVFSVVMSLFTVVNQNAVEDHLFIDKYIGFRDSIRFVLYAVLFYLATRLVAFALAGFEEATDNKRKLPRIKLSLLMFASWLPYLLIFLPGVANYDTANQVNDFFNGVSPVPFGFIEGQKTVNVFLNAHHPIVPTFIFSFFIWLGTLVGSATLGFLLYIMIQMLAGAFLISGILCDVYENATSKRGKKLAKAARLFYMFMPFIPMYMICMLKNTMHSLLFILLIYVLYRYFIGKDDKPAKSWLLFCLIEIMLCVTLNTGIFVVVITAVGVLFTKDKNKVKILLAAIACSLLWYGIFPKVIYPTLNIYPGGRQELYGTLFQQTARLIRDKEEAFTDSDKEIIEAVLDYDRIKKDFAYNVTDPVKDTFNPEASDEAVSEYLKMWLKKGLQHPIIYLRATMSICGHFFSPDVGIQIFSDIPKASGIFGEIHNIAPSRFGEKAASLYFKITIMPVVKWIFQTVLYAFWIPVYLFYMLVFRDGFWGKNDKKRPETVILLPIFINVLFLIVSPMNYSRYALCLIFASPICLALLCSDYKRS
ncbi:DUF6020 family protein [Butyrivibrio sp. JL13D10]|uniref:DUF6020 family protein n=1 Tax=Butyrivibrio sp. JL13D10 TaxID=3236815 RepID=UPI0038B4CAB6